MSFGNRVRVLRGESGMTQQQLAARMDVSVSYISKVENDALHFGDYPSEKFIHRLAAELKADEDELMVLADNVPKEIRKQIRRRPGLFQAIAKLDEQSLDRLTNKLVKKQ